MSAPNTDAGTPVSTPAPPMKKPTKLQWIVLGAYLVNTFCTFFSMTGKWTDGCTNSSQSDKYFTLITPPGWAFAIWGIIFTWEAVACVIAFVPQWQGKFSGLMVDNTFTLFWVATCLLQSLWSVVFCWAVKASWVVLLLVWLSLLGLQQTSLAKLANLPNTTSAKIKVALYGLLIAPFSLHLGWVTAAATLNANLSIVAYLQSPETLTTVAICSIVFVTAVGWTFGVTGLPWTKNHCDPVFAAGILWAVNAISHHNTTKPIQTTEGLSYIFPSSINGPLASSATFVFYFLAIFLVIRLAMEGLIKVFKKEKTVDSATNYPEIGSTDTMESPLLEIKSE